MPKRNKQLKVQNNKRLEVKWLKDVVDNDNDDDDDMDYQYERFTRVQSSEGASWKEYIYMFLFAYMSFVQQLLHKNTQWRRFVRYIILQLFCYISYVLGWHFV